MSSIAEGYKVIKREGEEGSTPDPVQNADNLISAACSELHESLQERCTYHEAYENTLVIQTGKEDTPGIVVEVKGYQAQEGVTTAAQQEDATKISDALPPTHNIPEATDQVEEIRQYNTAQYMKHSVLNPKKFG